MVEFSTGVKVEQNMEDRCCHCIAVTTENVLTLAFLQIKAIPCIFAHSFVNIMIAFLPNSDLSTNMSKISFLQGKGQNRPVRIHIRICIRKLQNQVLYRT